MASRNGNANNDLVQVSSSREHNEVFLTSASFLLKDAEDDIAERRLKA